MGLISKATRESSSNNIQISSSPLRQPKRIQNTLKHGLQNECLNGGVNQEDSMRLSTNTTGYRIYTIENMAECSLHAIRSVNKTWQTIRDSDLRLECPCRRSDVLDLEACFDAAISYSSGNDNWGGDQKTAMVDRDYMSIQAKIAEKYMLSSDTETRTLTSACFEQKWSDIILGELEAMLMVSFLEQGTLLRKVRIQYASNFSSIETLHSNCVVISIPFRLKELN